ncbi:probable cytochrome P450 6a13 isoform X2 [Penaeus japonicus]|uniref:probable cytochrome P450 6a13 isoform X2 n=1 Tax=Penaeus japonicus TaxID=27405 RepID=UPI001C70ED97|nr:probable cytochrome P450 6a13 isoform X2 [Penaeus japonicus]
MKTRSAIQSFSLRSLALGIVMLAGAASGYVLTAVLLLCASSLLLRYLQDKHAHWRTLGVPSPPATLLVGHTLRRLGLSMPFMTFFDEMYNDYNGRDFCGYYDFLKPGLFIGNPELIKSILVKDFEHFSDRRTFDLGKVNPIANDMLTNATGAHWRLIRSVVSPAFTATKTRRLLPLMAQRAAHLTRLAMEEATKGPVEARALCGRYTMDSIASCAFGIECEALSSDAAAFPKMAAKIFQLSPARALKIVTLLVAPKLAQVVHKLGIDFTSPEFHFFRHVVSHTLRMREESGIRRGDFLDLMMETKANGKEGLSDNTMAAQAILFLLAGYDNTANTLSLALYLLAHHPEAQATLRRELAFAKLRNGGELTHDHIMELPYLDAVVSETLRLYPAAPVIERICTKQYTIGGTSVTLERGQPVIIPVWNVHRDPRHWTDPLTFKPERFVGRAKDSIIPYSYLPFGQGPRSCIGLRFALLGIKVGLLHLLTAMEVKQSSSSVYPVPLDPKVLTLQPKDGIYVDLKPLEAGIQDAIKGEIDRYPPSGSYDKGLVRELEMFYATEDSNTILKTS